MHRLGCLTLQSMLAGLPEQAGIKLETPQNVQTAGMGRPQPVVQRQGDFVAILHAAAAQTFIQCQKIRGEMFTLFSDHNRSLPKQLRKLLYIATQQGSETHLLQHSTTQHSTAQHSTVQPRRLGNS